MYGIWAYLSTFSRVWAVFWKLGSGSKSGSASGWKVGSAPGSASNKNQTLDPHPDPHQGDMSNPDPHHSDADPQHWPDAPQHRAICLLYQDVCLMLPARCTSVVYIDLPYSDPVPRPDPSRPHKNCNFLQILSFFNGPLALFNTSAFP